MAVPVLQALLLADHVYRDATTGKHVIAGVFAKVFFIPKVKLEQQANPQPGVMTEVPIQELMRAGSPFAYISMTDVHGTKSFELRYVDLSNNDVLFRAELTLTSNDPLQNIELSVPLPVLPVPHEGAFVIELLCENELLGSHRILATPQPDVQ